MLIIDRFEGSMAIIEYYDSTIELPRRLLPENVKEGDVIKIVIDKENTKARKQNIKNLTDELFE